jgi:hypothetical protein
MSTRLKVTIWFVIISICNVSVPARAQSSADVDIPDVIAAGEDLKFTVTLDVAPNFNGGVIRYYISGPDGEIATSVAIENGSRTASGSINIPEAASSGTWYFGVIDFWTGVKSMPMNKLKVPFQVVAKQHLIIPTSATVQINPSQIQLFRTEASKLQARIHTFKIAAAEATSVGSAASFAKAVSRNLDDAIRALDKTRDAFQTYASTSEQKQRGEVFFADLRRSYVEMEKKISKSSMTPISYKQNSQAQTMEMPHKQTAPFRYDLVTEAALRPFEQNELAYTIVADTKSLAFDLVVKSNPAGATVCYHRSGDPCRNNPEGTNTTITGLTYAIWYVKFEKAGYKSTEIEHDPYREPNHVISVELSQ